MDNPSEHKSEKKRNKAFCSVWRVVFPRAILMRSTTRTEASHYLGPKKTPISEDPFRSRCILKENIFKEAVDPSAIKAFPAHPPITPRTMIASFRFLPEGVGICGGRPPFLTVNYSSRRVILCHRAWSFSQGSELRERIDKALRNFRDRIPTESRRKPF
ncbi:hypothetical protein TNIN_334081 [Trichonephila inaurata madagascariensis]|uniref:Uncharacterized protein n=1 Tax=Trichonephila inaurata madagascariensis TaxID=2747483 RepID=A0A8X7C387_9ARAC|nr:hypothetical protein TNIN_334081 [Trichonephila inaurata madagascariensis]